MRARLALGRRGSFGLAVRSRIHSSRRDRLPMSGSLRDRGACTVAVRWEKGICAWRDRFGRQGPGVRGRNRRDIPPSISPYTHSGRFCNSRIHFQAVPRSGPCGLGAARYASFCRPGAPRSSNFVFSVERGARITMPPLSRRAHSNCSSARNERLIGRRSAPRRRRRSTRAIPPSTGGIPRIRNRSPCANTARMCSCSVSCCDRR